MAYEKILIIENKHCSQGESLAVLLSPHYETESVKCAQEGLEKIGQIQFDLVLADASLPEMDGLQLLQRLNQIQDDVPAVIMTGSLNLQKAVLSMKFGAQGFIVKPFTPDELLKTVDTALQKNRLARERENIRLFEALEAAHFDAMKALAQAIEAKDHYTRGHCDRMVEYAVAIAKGLGLSEMERKVLRYAAALHDIGKIGIPETILNKAGKLTEEEYTIMKAHPEKGAEIIRGVSFLAPVAPLIYHHQERYDGKGYPDGLVGDEIPLGSRIVAVLDTFDAMTSDRPYRRALSLERAIAELKLFSKQQFDPLVVDVFLRVLRERSWELHQFPHSDVPANDLACPMQPQVTV